MSQIDALMKLFNDKKIRYQVRMTPRGSTFLLELDHKGQTIDAILVCSEDYGITAIEIYSKQVVDPMKYWDIHLLISDLNFNRKVILWHLLETGYYCIRHSTFFDWNEFEKFPMALKRMHTLFLSCSPFIEDLSHGRKTYSDTFDEMKKLNLIKLK